MDNQAHKHTNQLIHEASPYLQQHAHNPVNWLPWGEAAIGKARREDKPILLSIGYSTCHWCHVMEKETFENEDLAPLFNDHFICIKVDREERPDLDHVYMNFTQALTGQGGWPMNVFLTPDLKPFYAATYIPPAPRGSAPGIAQVLSAIQDVYHNNRAGVEEITRQVIGRVKEEEERVRQERSALNEAIVDELAKSLALRFDKSYHGFGSSPKFPTPQNLLFLLNYSRIKGNEGVEPSPFAMAKDTIESMYRGGIYDQVDGGLSRYSVDRHWLVPHFEKMLYDNAQFMEVLALAFSQQPLPLFRRAYDKTLGYLSSAMRAGDLYYSAEDADSEGHEGKFYVFTEDEIDAVLGQDAAEFKRIYHVTARGNFEGKNILNLIGSPIDVASGADARFEPSLQKLRALRSTRIRPHRDEKILFAWNAMLVRAMAKGASAFSDPHLLEKAQDTMGALEKKLTVDGLLHTSRRDDVLGPPAILDDYAYGAWARIALYEAAQTDEHLLRAIELTEEAIRLFWDEESHGFHIARRDTPDLIMNPVEPYDGAVASGNSIMANVLADLGLYTHEVRYRDLAISQFERFSGALTGVPEAVVSMVDAYARLEMDGATAVITGPDLACLRQIVKDKGLTGRIQLLPADSRLRRMGFLGSLDAGGDVYRYACSKGRCALPEKLS